MGISGKEPENDDYEVKEITENSIVKKFFYTNNGSGNYYSFGEHQNLVEAAAEIQKLLEHLEKSYSTTTTAGKMAITTEAISQLDNNPTLAARILNALKAGGTSAFQQFLNHPAAGFVIGALEDWYVQRKRNINTGGGNYNEHIEGNYIQGNFYAVHNYGNKTSSEQEQTFPELCKNRKSLNDYLKSVVINLKQKLGFLEIKNNIIDCNQALKIVARKTNFDMSIGFVPTRGEAFFIFAELEQVNIDSLREISHKCLNYAKSKANTSTVGGVVYNFKFPTNLCFTVALVDELNENTRRDIQTINPLKHSVDSLWYEIPIVYELNNKQLYFYEKPFDWTDYFTGEVAWKPIRKIIQAALIV
ncbi:hypothetical protein LC593_20920 [Nostoc sp. CHAB 5844]|nr:hypothetical protein [Nostoc sp. CHAB 5844]